MKARSILNAMAEAVAWPIRMMPTRFGVFLRRNLYRRYMAGGTLFDLEPDVAIDNLANLSLGKDTCIESRCTLLCSKARLTLGSRCYLNKNVRLGSGGDAHLLIGDNVMIGPNVVMDTSRHNSDRIDIPMREQGLSYAPIVVGDDVWIGANAVVTCGVVIGRGCIVGAGAVVTREVPEYSVVGGVPARVLSKRNGA